MSKKEPRKESGGKLTRSETVTVRLDPKLRYLADLAARKQRRTLSSFIEWAIEDSLGRVELVHRWDYGNEHILTIKDETETLWDVDEADRLCKLAVAYPDLLTHEEQRLWKLAKELSFAIVDEKAEKTWGLFIEGKPIEQAIRILWPYLWKHIDDEISYQELVQLMQKEIQPISHWENKQTAKPRLNSVSKPSSQPASYDDIDDDIPF